jgi:hypothetical protein
MAAQITPIQVPVSNGVVRSFGHVRANIAGLDMTGGFKSIKRSRKRTRSDVLSNNADPTGKTLGTNKYMCSAEIYLDWYYNVIAQLQGIGVGYGDVPFIIYITYVGAGLVTYTDQVINCTFDTDDGDDKAGNDPLIRNVDFGPTKILFNGLDDAADPLTGSPA